MAVVRHSKRDLTELASRRKFMDLKTFTAELMHLEERFAALAPELELTVRDPELGVEGYVVVWTTLTARHSPLGRVGKGGTRITPATSLEEIKMLARIMALKNAAAGLPLGGAKSGMRDNPASPGFEQRLRRFAQLAAPTLVERGGIFGGFGFDIGVKPEHARIVCDELQSTRCFTGKPLDMGGTDYDREGIAGLGVSVSAVTALEFEGTPVHGSTFAVQGLGAMGAAIVRYFSEAGGVLRAVSDPMVEGTYLLKRGASSALIDAIAHHNWDVTRLLLQTEGHKVDLNDVLYQPVDVFFPAAVQNVITEANVAGITAKRVVEAANSPVTTEARTALYRRGVLVLPDFIVNAGGIIAAYVEMSSTMTPEENLKTKRNSEDAKALTRERIRDNVTRTLRISSDTGVEPSLAARYLALRNIFSSLSSTPVDSKSC
jgi:glutamate dehydrogenase (NAD(P)+)